MSAVPPLMRVESAWRWRPAFVRPYRYFALRYRRTWRGTLTLSILYPILYLLAMGIGLGHLVDSHLSTHGGLARLGGVGYVVFIAPGLLVSTAMQWGTNESMYPVMAGLKWLKTYHALLATPIEVKDIVHAHLLWVATRVATSSLIFLAVLAAFGDIRSPLAVLSLPVAILTGVAFAAPVTAFTATQDNDSALPLIYRMCIVPLFLFSGTFFPISQLPGWVQLVARLTPLYHGVALARGLVIGHLSLVDDAGHAAYLLAMMALGIVLARRSFERRLIV
ncbi:MAG: ABC transporter permease [Acidimicrobiales bacterium]